MEDPNKPKTKNVQTYAEDMTKAFESGEKGLVKKIIHEQEKQEEEKRKFSPESGKNRLFTLVGLALIVVAFSILIVLFFYRQSIPSLGVVESFVPIIFTDRTNFVDVSGLNQAQIARAVQNQANATDVPTGKVEGVYLVEDKKVLGLRKFLTLLEGGFPKGQINLAQDNFFIGILGPDRSADPYRPGDLFFIFKVRSFPDIFPILRAWERSMFADLAEFLGTAITADTNYLLTQDFVDDMVENKNARILYDHAGSAVFMYVFVDDTSVVISTSLPATQEAIFRLSAGEIRR